MICNSKRLAVPFVTNLPNWKSQVSKKYTGVATKRFSVALKVSALVLQLSLLPKLEFSISFERGQKKYQNNYII